MAKKIIIGVIVFFFLVALIAGMEEPTQDPIQEEQTEEYVKEVEGNVLEIMEETLGEGFYVKLEDKKFSLTPKSTDFAIEVAMAIEGYPVHINDWNEYVRSQKKVSMAVQQHLPGYQVATINPMNTDNTLLLVEDGVVLYNVLGK